MLRERGGGKAHSILLDLDLFLHRGFVLRVFASREGAHFDGSIWLVIRNLTIASCFFVLRERGREGDTAYC